MPQELKVSDTSIELIETLNENKRVQECFCMMCPAIRIDKGPRGEFGVRTEPDEYVCPCDYDFSDSRCHRSDKYAEVESLIDQIAEILDSIGD